ncbi:hypothetical protein ACN47A_27620 [Myxococcus fulvus]|uniref:hypothetical protein n=1 Tax=Myxococcus fulvus TaxID=33 RepID=UPI003B98E4FB
MSEYVEHATVSTSYSSLRSRTAEGSRFSYGGPSVRAILHQELPGCESPGMFRARVSASRLTTTSSMPDDLTDRSAWAVGLGATYSLPPLASSFLWLVDLEAEYGGGLGFASELVPAALDDVLDAGVSPGLAFRWYIASIELDGYTRYRQLFGAGGARRGLWDGGVMIDPLFFAQSMRGVSRLGYQYSHELTKGAFQSHELRLGYLGYLGGVGNGRVGIDGVVELSRVDASRSVRAFHVRLALERF